VSEANTASAPVQATSRSRGRVLLPVLLFLLAIAVFGAALYFVGGVDYVNTLFSSVTGGSPSKPSTPAAAVVPTPTPTPVATGLVLPPGVSEELAQRMYVEQIESQANLEKMADGEIVSFEITSVETKNERSAVFVRARFADGSAAPGVIQFVRIEGIWYFMSITGLRPSNVGGSAETIQRGSVEDGERSNAEVIAESGVTVFDEAVMTTVLEQQRANQSIIVAMIDGSLTDLKLGAPGKGAGTTTVPSTLTGPKSAPVAGEAVLIHKSVDAEDLTFLTMFRAN